MDSLKDSYKKYLDPKNKIISFSLVQLSLYDILFILSVAVFFLFRQCLMHYIKPTDPLITPSTAAHVGGATELPIELTI